MTSKILMGIDIETAGPQMGVHPLLAVGLSVWELGQYDTEQALLDDIEVHFNGDINKYDRGTLEFWRKNKAAWAHIKRDCVSEEEGAKQLINFIKGWQLYAFNKNISFCIITDNCWFDDTWTSNLLCKYGGLPLRHNYYTGYTKLSNVIDINQLILGARLCGIYNIPDGNVKRDLAHTPVSDTKKIVGKYIAFVNYTKKIKNKVKHTVSALY